MKTTVVKIRGMECSGCSAAVENAVRSIRGVAEATADLQSDSAEVVYDDDIVTLGEIKQAVETAGFVVVP